MKKIAVMMAVALMLGSLLPVALIVDTGVVRAQDTGLPEIEYTVHAPIRINNETNLTEMALSEGWTGDGSPSDPYIIGGYNISGQGAGIYIGNTTSHIIITGCYIHDITYVSYPYFWGASIETYNASNVLVDSNLIERSSTGVMLVGSDNCEIFNNSLNESTGYAVYIRDGSENNTVHMNTMGGNTYGGVMIYESDLNSIFDNDISGGTYYGIASSYSYGSSIENNSIESCQYGVYSVGGVTRLIGGLTVRNVSTNLCDFGIYLDSTPDSVIRDSSVTNFTNDGITVYAYSNHTQIINCGIGYSEYLSDSPRGMVIDHSSDVLAYRNHIGALFATPGADGRSFGVYVTSSSGVNISGNNIEYMLGATGQDGVAGSDGSDGTDGSAGSDAYGIYVESSDNITVEDSLLSEIYGGDGGAGGDGGNGNTGIPGDSGGNGGNGGNGGDAFGIYLTGSTAELTGNTLWNVSGGNGGNGGTGGDGTDGDGYTYTDGSGGNGGNGGNGGDALGIAGENEAVSVNNNEIYRVSSGNGGNGGSGGSSGFTDSSGIGGNGGDGGDSGTLGVAAVYLNLSENSSVERNEIYLISPGTAGYPGPGGMGSAYDGVYGLPGTVPVSGAIFLKSSNDLVSGNYLHDIPEACVLVDSSQNMIYHNNFVNTSDAIDTGSNSWDSGYPCGGNYWDVLYTGDDLYSGPGQNISGSDGIGDSPHNITGASSTDRYPLMTPWGYSMVLSAEPTDSESPVSANVVVMFDRSMDTSTIPQLGQTSGDRVGYTFLGWSSTNLPNDTAMWSHTDWTLDDVVGLRVYGFSDAYGNPGMPYCWNFHTLDPDAPLVLSTEPSDGEEGVSTWTYVTVVFDDNMNTSIVPSISDDHGTAYTFQGWSDTNLPNDTAIWSHADWPDSVDITIDLSGGEDTSGNVMAPYNWTFTIVDLTAPSVLFTEPANGDTGVNMSMNVTVVFSESLNTSYNGGSPTLDVLSGNDTGGWVFLGWSSTNVENDTATWSHNPWKDEETMQLRVYDYQDLVGHDGTVYSWTFVTEDITAPYVVGTVPADGATGVSESTDVKVVFSESMDTSVIPVLAQSSGDLVNYTFAGWSSTYVDNDTAIWTHENWTTSNTGRDIGLIVSDYADPSGNYGNDHSWNFTVVDKEPPVVLSTDPADGDIWVPLDKVVTVIFSETMSYADVYGEIGVNYTFLGWSTTNVHNDTGMWAHTNWSENTDLLITVDFLRDEAGNSGPAYTFTIHTADITPPRVDTARTRPYDGQGAVAYDANVSVVFSESINTSTIPTLVQNSGDPVSYTFLGWFSTNVANDTAVWGHDNWTDSDTIVLTVSDYYDLAGNVGDNYTWEFHILDTIAPYVVSTSPYDGERNVDTALQQIKVVCSEPMSTGLSPEIYYVEASGNRPTITFYMWLNDTTAIFNVSGYFSEEDHIRLRTGSGFEDRSGNALPYYYWWFYIYDPNPPYVVDVGPSDGSLADKNETVYVAFSELLDESFVPAISQASDDPGGWIFLGWEIAYYNVSGEWKDVSKASWAHNNWTSESVNLTVSGYFDYGNNEGGAFSWEFNVQLYQPHSMIRINDDAEMDSMAASEGWRGDGTPANPYIIEGYGINGDDGRGGYCIYVGNTTRYFMIMNNSLNYAWTDNPVEPYFPRAAVVLYNAPNAVVEHNSMKNIGAFYGVYAIDSDDVQIAWNIMGEYWGSGIFADGCQYIYIHNNTMSGDGHGIYLNNSYFGEVERNSLEANGDNNGISLENSSYAEIYGNEIRNYSSGVVFDSGDGKTVNITMESNSMLNCGLMIWGWQYDHWTSHIIENNTVNRRPLVFLNGIDDGVIDYTTRAGQIFVVDCYNISVSEQFLVRATVGVYIAVSQQITITNTTLGYNMYGVYIIASTGNLVWHNNFVGNDVQAWDDGDPGDNSWNSAYPYGGNYWDDYSGDDLYAGPDQNLLGSDGIGDTERPIDGGSSTDAYPLVEPTALVFYYTPGWHMVAFPWLDTPTEITTALSGASWDRAMTYVNGTWQTYNANRDAKYNLGFPLIDRSIGLWVNFTDYSVINGASPIHTGNITVHIHRGWTLVEGGFPFLVSEMFGDVQYRYIKSANLTNPAIMESLGDNDTLVPGRAYWVYAEDDYTITIDTDNFKVSVEPGIVVHSISPPTASSDSVGSEESGAEVQNTESSAIAAPLLVMVVVFSMLVVAIARKQK